MNLAAMSARPSFFSPAGKWEIGARGASAAELGFEMPRCSRAWDLEHGPAASGTRGAAPAVNNQRPA